MAPVMSDFLSMYTASAPVFIAFIAAGAAAYWRMAETVTNSYAGIRCCQACGAVKLEEMRVESVVFNSQHN